MNCIICGTKTGVIKTFSDVNEVYQLRECASCGDRMLTREVEALMSELPDLYRYDKARRAALKESPAS